MDGRTEGQTGGGTDGRTDGRTDGQFCARDEKWLIEPHGDTQICSIFIRNRLNNLPCSSEESEQQLLETKLRTRIVAISHEKG